MSVANPDHGDLRPEAPRTYYDDLVRIPGFDAPPDRCRPLSPVGVCDHGHPVLGRSSCGVRGCPDHWRDWAEGAVEAIVSRLAAYREARDPRAAHVVVSPPQDRRYSIREMWDTRSDANDVLKSHGVPGGATVTHPFGATDRAKSLYKTAQEQGDLPESTGIWRFLRESADDWEDLKRYTEARPHYHVLAPIGDVQPPESDWIVKRIRSFKPFYYQDSEAYRDMARTAYYVLTHGAVQQGRQTTSYMGALHPASFDPEEELTAAKWERIQIEAAKAVSRPGDDSEGDGEDIPGECPRDGCEAAVHPWRDIWTLLDNEEWCAKVRAGREGQDRWRELKGTVYWWEEGGAPPPPNVRASRERLLAYLRDRGDLVTPDATQVGLAGAGAEW